MFFFFFVIILLCLHLYFCGSIFQSKNKFFVIINNNVERKSSEIGGFIE